MARPPECRSSDRGTWRGRTVRFFRMRKWRFVRGPPWPSPGPLAFVTAFARTFGVRHRRRKDVWRLSPSSQTMPTSPSTRVTLVSRTTGSSRPFTPALTVRPGRSGGEQTARRTVPFPLGSSPADERTFFGALLAACLQRSIPPVIRRNEPGRIFRRVFGFHIFMLPDLDVPYGRRDPQTAQFDLDG